MVKDEEKKMPIVDLTDAKNADKDDTAKEINKLKKKLKKQEKALTAQKEQTEKFETDKNDYIAALQKERAEFDNFRKRSLSQTAASFNNGVEDTVAKILPVLDNLDLALSHAPAKQDDFVNGIVNVQKLFATALDAMGVTKMNSLGKPFDHNMHHALLQVDKQEDEEAGIIKQVHKEGYILGEKVLRYAEVIVTK